MLRAARDGRDSPLKYTGRVSSRANNMLGMAGIHRSSTLAKRIGDASLSLGMAGIHRSSTLGSGGDAEAALLGMAGIHRSSTLDLCSLNIAH